MPPAPDRDVYEGLFLNDKKVSLSFSGPPLRFPVLCSVVYETPGFIKWTNLHATGDFAIIEGKWFQLFQ